MKNLFLNSRLPHYLYATTIVLLGAYIYLSSVSIDQYEEVAKAMDSDHAILENTSHNLKIDLDRETMAYRNSYSLAFQEDANQVLGITEKCEENINALIKDFEIHAKNFPVFLQKTAIPTRLFFTKEILSQHQQEITNHQVSFFLKIRDRQDKSTLAKQLFVFFKEKKEKLNELPAYMAILELKKEKANLKSMEITFLNYTLSKLGGNLIFDKFLLDISPNVGIPKLNEKFSADLAAVAFASDFKGQEAIFTVNGKVLEVKNGIAHYETQCLKVGKQSIHATLSLKNLLSGEVRSATKDYTYEVLPK